MCGPFDDGQRMAAALGCSPEDLIYAPQSVRDEADGKKRALADGSVTDLNDTIRSHIKVKGSSPGSGDLEHAFAIDEQEDVPSALLKVDAKKAHRRCKTAQKDFKKQCCKVTVESKTYHYYNKVGTYGYADAQLKWGRLAGILHRLLLRFSFVRWIFTYVDDVLMLLRARRMWLEASGAIILLWAFGFPFSWKKLLVSIQGIWTGRYVDCTLRIITPTDEKKELIQRFLEKVVDGHLLTPKVVQRGISQTRWVAQNVPQLAVFLQPLHEWSAAITGPSKPGLLCRCVSEFTINMLEMEPAPIHFHMPWLGEAASDASASKDEAIIGGWATEVLPADRASCHWFSINLQRTRFWWAWTRGGDPRRLIGALELLAMFFLGILISEKFAKGHVKIRAGAKSDNLGICYATMKEYSRRMPTAAVHMELAAYCWRMGMTLEIEHVRRERNTWADDLTHADFSGEWNEELRWTPDIGKEFFKVLDKVLAVWDLQSASASRA